KNSHCSKPRLLNRRPPQNRPPSDPLAWQRRKGQQRGRPLLGKRETPNAQRPTSNVQAKARQQKNSQSSEPRVLKRRPPQNRPPSDPLAWQRRKGRQRGHPLLGKRETPNARRPTSNVQAKARQQKNSQSSEPRLLKRR